MKFSVVVAVRFWRHRNTRHCRVTHLHFSCELQLWETNTDLPILYL